MPGNTRHWANPPSPPALPGRNDVPASAAELEGITLPEPPPIPRAAGASDDQATALRRMFEVASPAAKPAKPPPLPGQHAKGAADWSPTPEFNARLNVARRAKIVTIASGKGGVGKTNVSVNTAIALARRGLRVTLVDADLGTANADVICGISPTNRLEHVLASSANGHTGSLAKIAIDAPGGFRLVPGSAGIGRIADLSAMERRVLLSGLVELAADADIILIDSAAGVGQNITAFLNAADLALIVATPEPTAVADAYALIKCLVLESEMGASVTNTKAGGGGGGGGGGVGGPAKPTDNRLALIINQAREPLEAFSTHARIARVCDRFLGVSLPMIGYIAQDVRVGDSVRAQKPLLLGYPDSAAARSISDLAAAIINTLGLPRSRAQGAGNPPPTPPAASATRGVAGLVRRLLGFSPAGQSVAEKS
ncbi:MAG TPA: AAA family ATPase [Phycisphaerales bacterium]|nr:AAA family ATPase [Phycisphaerales bacterium]